MTPPTRRELRAQRALQGALLAGVAAALLAVLCPPLPGGAPSQGDALVGRWSVDLATAPAWQLVLVPGIGVVRARAIVAERERDEGPPLRGLEDLQMIHGIGPALVGRLRNERLPVAVLLHGRPVQGAVGEPPDDLAPLPPSLPTMGP